MDTWFFALVLGLIIVAFLLYMNTKKINKLENQQRLIEHQLNQTQAQLIHGILTEHHERQFNDYPTHIQPEFNPIRQSTEPLTNTSEQINEPTEQSEAQTNAPTEQSETQIHEPTEQSEAQIHESTEQSEAQIHESTEQSEAQIHEPTEQSEAQTNAPKIDFEQIFKTLPNLSNIPKVVPETETEVELKKIKPPKISIKNKNLCD